MQSSKSIRDLLLEQLSGKNAHVDINRATKDLSFEDTGVTVEGLPHTIWQLIEHIRLAQNDILESSKNSDYEAIGWPEDILAAVFRAAR